MSVRPSKVRTTDFRSSSRPAVSNNAWNAFEAAARKEKAAHDVAVAGYSLSTLYAIAADLNARPAWEASNTEHRWIMGRRAAALRAILTARQS